MKPFILSVLLMCGLTISAQRIKISEFDTETNTRRIGTSAQYLTKGLGNDFALALRSEDTTVYMQLSFLSNCEGLVAADNALVFQLENNSIIVVHSKGLQVRLDNYTAPYEYHISLQEVKMLQQSTIKSISFYEAGGQYKTKLIAVNNKGNLQQLCNVFLNEYEKTPVADNTAKLLNTR
jgi:hypothetical protein